MRDDDGVAGARVGAGGPIERLHTSAPVGRGPKANNIPKVSFCALIAAARNTFCGNSIQVCSSSNQHCVQPGFRVCEGPADDTGQNDEETEDWIFQEMPAQAVTVGWVQ